MNSETSRTLELIQQQKNQCQTSNKNGYKVGTSYKTKNAGKGQEKFFIKFFLVISLVKMVDQWNIGQQGGWITIDI